MMIEPFVALPKNGPKSFYIYELDDQGKKAYGLVALLSCRKGIETVLLKHEQTIPHQVEKLYAEFTACDTQYKPLILIHQHRDFQSILSSLLKTSSFVHEDSDEEEIKHRLWQICDQNMIEQLKKAASDLGPLCIADGHHRFEALSCYYQNQFPYLDEMILVAIFDTQQITTKPTCILFNTYFTHAMFESHSLPFIREPLDSPRLPRNIYECIVRKNQTWFSFQLKEHLLREAKEKGSLSREIFSEFFLKHFVNKDLEIFYDKHPIQALMKKMHANQNVGVILSPDSPEEVFKCAMQRRILEANSTCFTPKLLHGFIASKLIYDRNMSYDYSLH